MTHKITDESAFFGKVTAGISHDLNNVLAVIRESVGLLTDLMENSGDYGMDMEFSERLAERLGVVQDQVSRCSRLTWILNSFSHLPDKRPKVVCIRDFLNDFRQLFSTPPRRTGFALTLCEVDGNSSREICPVRFEMALFACLEGVYEVYPDKDRFIIDSGENDSGCWVRICSAADATCFSEENLPQVERVKAHVSDCGFFVQWVGRGFEIHL